MRRDDSDPGAPDAHVSERLDAYRTGELDEAGHAHVEAHLAECERCREELAALASWTSVIERGYEARRRESVGSEPDWAAQRVAIVARTSGRARERRGAFRRWAPQVALMAVAALIVGIVWRENPREPVEPSRTAQSERASAPSERGAVETQAPANGAGESDDALGRVGPRSRRAGDPAPPSEPPAADEPTAAAPPAEETLAQQEPAAALEKEAGRDADQSRMERRAALADRVAEPSLDAPLAASLADVERFEREARAALEARDTTAARRALALWRDTLSARGDTLAARDGIAGRPVSLADSLRELLETAE